MSFQAGSVTSSLGLDVSPFAQGMLQAQSLMSIFPQHVTNFLANPMLGFIGVLQSATRALVGFFNEGTARADKFNDVADSIGVPVEQLTSLGKVAEQAGSSTDAVADAFKFLGKNASEAAAGSATAMAAFQRLGISSKTVGANLGDLDKLMMMVADGLKGMEAADRTAASMDLLGRSGTDLIPTLKQGSAAIQEQREWFASWGAVVTQKAAESADRFGDAMGKISAAWEGLKQYFSDEVRVKLVEKLEEFVVWLDAHKAQIKDFASTAAEWIVWGFEKAAQAVDFLKEHFLAFAAILTGGVLLGGIAATIIALGALAAAYDRLAASIARAGAAQGGFAGGMKGLGTAIAGAGIGYVVGSQTNENSTGGQVGGLVGGLAGSWAGAKGGAAAGAFFGPWGALIGGGIGAIGGAIGGGYLGGKAGDAIEDGLTEDVKQLSAASKQAMENTKALRFSFTELSKAADESSSNIQGAARVLERRTPEESDTTRPGYASERPAVEVKAVNVTVDPSAVGDAVATTLRPIVTDQVRVLMDRIEARMSHDYARQNL